MAGKSYRPAAARRRRSATAAPIPAASGGATREDHVDTTAVEIAQLAVQGAGVLGGVVRSGEDADRMALGAQPLGPRLECGGGNELDTGIGRVVRREGARRGDLPARPAREHRADDARELVLADAADAQHDGLGAGDVDDGRLDSDRARPTVEHEIDIVTEVVAHVLRRGRTHPTETVRRGRGDATAERVEQGERKLVIGDAQAHGVATAGRDTADATGITDHDQRERARPKGAREHLRHLGNVAAELVELRRAGHVHDHRVIGGAALDREQSVERVGIRGVGAEPVHGLGRERDEASGAQGRDRLLDHQ